MGASGCQQCVATFCLKCDIGIGFCETCLDGYFRNTDNTNPLVATCEHSAPDSASEPYFGLDYENMRVEPCKVAGCKKVTSGSNSQVLTASEIQEHAIYAPPRKSFSLTSGCATSLVQSIQLSHAALVYLVLFQVRTKFASTAPTTQETTTTQAVLLATVSSSFSLLTLLGRICHTNSLLCDECKANFVLSLDKRVCGLNTDICIFTDGLYNVTNGVSLDCKPCLVPNCESCSPNSAICTKCKQVLGSPMYVSQDGKKCTEKCDMIDEVNCDTPA